MPRTSAFGKLADGRSVESLLLGSDAGLQLEVLTYGAILRRLSFPVRGKRRELILKLDTLDDYVRDTAYVGSLVGRFGNRIANSRFTLDGKSFELSANEGVNHLHGGHLGFGKRVWTVLDVSAGAAARAVLAYRSPDGEEGYPGNLDATVEIEVGADAVSFTLTARADAPTPVNLTYHPYFNINESAPATEQLLRIPAARYLPVRAGLIPTGERAPVGDTFDFRALRRLHPPALDGNPQLGLAGGYDHCWVLDPDADCACELTSATRDLRLTLLGTGPGLQFYNGQYLHRAHPAIGSGVILEPQGLPDAPNQPAFPSAILRPGATWRTRIEYRLRAG